MKQNSYIESSIRLTQLEARLNKNSYLSRQNLPSHADAKVFLLIERSKKTPNRHTHPQLYHWYIIMKQFAKRTLETWIEMDDSTDQDDQLIAEFVYEMTDFLSSKTCDADQNYSKFSIFLKAIDAKKQNIQKSINTPKNSQKRRVHHNYVEFNENIHSSLKEISNWREKQIKTCFRERTPLNLITHKNQICSPMLELQFIMEMHLNIQNANSVSAVKEKLANQKIEILSFEVEEQSRLRVCFRIDRSECESLKDRVSKWSEVSNIKFRKEKKMGSRVEMRSENSINLSPLRKPKP